MNKEYSKYLPIGSVVMLKNGKKRLMITGYVAVDMTKKDKVYDYSGCLFPEGVISTQHNIVFDHENIEQIFCLGYSDDEQKSFAQNLVVTMTPEAINIMLTKAQNQAELENLD